MKIYNVVLEKKIQDNEKTILNSFNDLDEAKSFLCDEAHKTLDTIGKSLLDNFLMGNCECPEPYISVYCSNGDENGPFDQYDYSIEVHNIEVRDVDPMAFVYVVFQKTYINHYNDINVLKIFTNKTKAEEYIETQKQIILNKQNAKLNKYNDNKIDYNENDYIRFYIEYFHVE